MSRRPLGILAGPGVVREGCVEGLQRFAREVGCGVVNTWNAKGVFRWDDPLHFGTAGLQARDFDLAGLGDVDVLVTTGLDDAEVTSRPWEGRAEVIDVAPAELATAAQSLSLPRGSTDRPLLYTELAKVVGVMYESTEVPVPAPRAARMLAQHLVPGGLVVAEPGLAGFWIARTFPTTVAGSVVVPASPDAAVARALAVEAARDGRPTILVTTGEPDVDDWPPALEIVEWADNVDLDPAPLVAVAGPIVAWT